MSGPLLVTLAGPFRRLNHRLTRGDRLALALLVVLPIAIYLPFSLAGHPVMPGDDLIQNFPLRVLSGSVIRSGRLPAWDSLIWSGTPLLGGWNAGAMYPGTWLFAVLPGIAAWTINYISVPIIAGVGSYAFLRRIAVGPLGALVGALIFTDTGFMASQVVHIGLTQSSAFLPVLLFGIEGITRARSNRAATGSILLVAVAFALSILAGDPRGATTSAIVIVLYVCACAIRRNSATAVVLVGTAEAVALGIVLSAIQWLPGLGFLANSQRGTAAYSFFAAGSLTIGHLADELAVPFMQGGNGNFGLPQYSGSYNFPEVTLGCGIVALVAAFCYLPALWAEIAGWRSRREWNGRPLVIWYLIGVLGVILVLGTNTPIAHLLVLIPLYGHERLQNRNGELIDLALAVLAAYLVDDVGRARTRNEADRVDPLASRISRAWGLLPVAIALVLALVAFIAPDSLQRAIHLSSISSSFYTQRLPLIVVPMVITALCGITIAGAKWLTPGRMRLGLAAVVALDVGFFLVNANYADAPSSVLGGQTSLGAEVASLSGPDGRSALYNPSFDSPSPDPQLFNEIGVNDLNILRGERSVQGYGSIVQGTYQIYTNTHYYQDLNPVRLPGETYNTLDLKTFLTLPGYFETPIASGAPIPLAGGGSTGGPNEQNVTTTAPSPSGPWLIAPGGHADFLLATPMAIARATIVLQPGKTAPNVHALRAGFGTEGLPIATTPVTLSQGEAHLRIGGTTGNALEVENPTATPVTLGAALVITNSPSIRLQLNGTLQGLLTAPHWRYTGTIGPFSAFTNTETRGLAWLQPTSKDAPRSPETAVVAPGSVQLTSTGASTAEQMLVHSPGGALLVRSETYSAGWTARITPVGGGPTRILTAHQFGLVQAVDLPAGNFIVTWKYAPADLLVGLVLSALGVLAALGIAFAARRHTAE